MRVPLELPAGLNGDDTAYAAAGRWAHASNVRWNLGRPETIGGWESLTTTLLTGVCRAVMPWNDRASVLNIAFGTHSDLLVYKGGGLYVITPTGLAAGSIDGTGGAGYGTGTYSTGAYSEPSAADYFPRTWALAAWGENLLACPRNGTIYAWTNNTAVVAASLANAPAQVTHMLVASQDQVFALGCNEEVSGVFNPLCIRHSSVRNNTEWATTSSSTAREYILPGGGRIVAGRVVGPYLLVWTTDALFLGTYVGSIGQPWRFDRVAGSRGLIGPNAAVIVGQAGFWIGPDNQFYRYALGGAPGSIDCPVRAEFDDNLAASQFDKIVASSTTAFNEIRFDYPDARDGLENSRFLSLKVAGPDGGAWSKGEMARTAYVDAGPSAYPIGVTVDGNIYYHERGNSADGAPFAWFIETADIYMDENFTVLAQCLWADFKDQVGPVNITITTRLKPQDQSPRTFGPYTVAAGEAKTDIRVQGRLFTIRYAGTSAPTFARLGKPIFDLKQQGRR